MVRELKEDLEVKPGAVVLSVGGGGLLCGVVQGLREVGWGDVPVIAMETAGAHSLNATLRAGQLVTLPEMTRYASRGCARARQPRRYCNADMRGT